MGARRNRSNSSRRRSSTRGTRTFRGMNIPMMALLIISILSNFPLTQTVAAQQQDNTPPPFPAPTAVTVIGNFQTAVGCDNDNDPACSATDLQLDDYGVWSGTFPVPGASGFATSRRRRS